MRIWMYLTTECLLPYVFTSFVILLQYSWYHILLSWCQFLQQKVLQFTLPDLQCLSWTKYNLADGSNLIPVSLNCIQEWIKCQCMCLFSNYNHSVLKQSYCLFSQAMQTHSDNPFYICYLHFPVNYYCNVFILYL